LTHIVSFLLCALTPIKKSNQKEGEKHLGRWATFKFPHSKKIGQNLIKIFFPKFYSKLFWTFFFFFFLKSKIINTTNATIKKGYVSFENGRVLWSYLSFDKTSACTSSPFPKALTVPHLAFLIFLCPCPLVGQ
jgi:hypothetical protein